MLGGQAAYLADIRVPGALHVAFVRSLQAHADLLSVDCTAARSLPGVVAVLAGHDLPVRDLVDDLHEVLPGLRATPQPVLARNRVRFVGEPIALVVAEDRYVAEDAVDLVEVEYAELPVRTSVAGPRPAEHALGPDGSDVVFHDRAGFGDPDGAFAAACHVIRHHLDTGRYAAAPLEPRGCIATYDPGRRRLEVWSSTQSEFVLRRRLAQVTGLPEASVRVRVPDVGGGFGQKIPVSPEEAAVALAAMRLARPLRWVEDRRENLMAAPHAKQQTLDLELAVAADGEFLGLRARIVGDVGAYSFNSASALIEPYIAARYLPGPYLIDNYEYDMSAVLTNKSPVAPYRGTGTTAAVSAMELLIDACAEETGMDRVALRARNLAPSDRFPYRTCNGKTFDSGSHREALEMAARVTGHAGSGEQRRRLRARGIRRGTGFAVVVESTGRPLIGRWKSSYDGARVTLEPDGGITLVLAVSAQGQGHATSLAQIAADALGAPLACVTVRSGDTDLAPLSTYGTRASRTAVVSGGAVRLGALELRARILATASAMTGCPVDELLLQDGVVRRPGSPEIRLDLPAIADAAYFNPTIRGQTGLPELSVTRGYDSPIVYSNACYVAEVEVDPGLGTVSVQRITAVEDCGTVINPLIVDGQVRGAVTQGLGGALLEELRYDPSGQMLASTLMDYRLPRSGDVPDIDVHHLCSPSSTTLLGAKGMGEAGAIGMPAAIACAVTDALGDLGGRVTQLPLTPERVLDMVEAGAPRAVPRSRRPLPSAPSGGRGTAAREGGDP